MTSTVPPVNWILPYEVIILYCSTPQDLWIFPIIQEVFLRFYEYYLKRLRYLRDDLIIQYLVFYSWVPEIKSVNQYSL